MPTQAQLDQVVLNAGRVMDLSNHLHDFMQDPVNEVYFFLSADANADSGYELICALLETAFELAALIEFPGAAIAGAFLPVFFSAASPPDVDADLRSQFGATWARLSQTFLDANEQLGRINDNPGAYWDTTYTSPVTGKQTLVSTLGDADLKMPEQHSEPFQQLTDRAIAKFRQDLTRSVLGGLYCVYYSDWYSSWQYQTKEQFFKDASDYIASWPAYFFKYRLTWKVKNGQKSDVVQNYNFSLVKQGSVTSTASDKLCAWLFQDDGYGHQTNAKGIAARSSVFFSWGLRVDYPDGKPFGIDEAVTSLARTAASPSKAADLDESRGPKPLITPAAQGAQT